jgi:hypothetical protein
MGTLWSTGCCEIAAATTGTTGVFTPPPEPELQPDVASATVQIAIIATANLGRAEELIGEEQSVVCIRRAFAALLRSKWRVSSNPSLLVVPMQLPQSQFK